jgi:2'-5' RNA ligase
MKKRLFIALNFDAPARLALARWLYQLPIPPGLIKTKADNLHLTLLFLGDTDEELIPRLSAELERVAQRFSPLIVSFDRLGGFPNLREPHTLWVGMAGANLAGLRQEVATQIIPLAPGADLKPFRPHLTIARVKTRLPGEVASSRLGEIAGSPLKLPPFSVGQIDLMESTLTPQGSVYKRISSHPPPK